MVTFQICVNACVCACVSVRVRVYVCLRMCARMCVLECILVCLCTRVYIACLRYSPDISGVVDCVKVRQLKEKS
jgi:hypothetical protein